jgi:putative Ca2+/H+ antiporter (TMEM165/GDT1 family)
MSAQADEHGRILTVSLTLMAAVFGIVFLAELPDKTALASLVLGTHYRPAFVFVGVAAAFAVQVIIAVSAGSVLSLAPRRAVEAIVAVLFLAGAVMMLRRGRHQPDDQHLSADAPGTQEPGLGVGTADDDGKQPSTTTVLIRSGSRRAGFWKVSATSFGVLFIAEFGDLTQIAIANLAAKYHDPLAVGIGALLGLWAVGGLAVLGGRQLLRWIPLTWIARAAALVMAVLGVISAVQAIIG